MPSEPGSSVGAPSRLRRIQYSWNQPTWPISQMGGSRKWAFSPSSCESATPSKSSSSKRRASTSAASSSRLPGPAAWGESIVRNHATSRLLPATPGSRRSLRIDVEPVHDQQRRARLRVAEGAAEDVRDGLASVDLRERPVDALAEPGCPQRQHDGVRHVADLVVQELVLRGVLELVHHPQHHHPASSERVD